MTARTKSVAVVTLLAAIVGVLLALAFTWSSNRPESAVPGVTRDSYPRVGVTTEGTPPDREREASPPCRSASDGSIVARPYVEEPPLPQQGPDSDSPPAPQPPMRERQDCPSV